MKLSEMRQILGDRRILLTKSLGQNFLHDANQVRRIVDLAEVGPVDHVLEIGPGLGPLTELLQARAGEVLAIEKDARLFAVLSERFAQPRPTGGSLRLIHGDALDHLGQPGQDWHDWKLVANLPYSVASSILVELALTDRCPERMVTTLQLEVVQRMMAGPGSRAYGILNLLIQLRYEARAWFKLPASCFFPAPDVDSGCISLHRRAVDPLDKAGRRRFERVVKRAFSERRKKMFKLLRSDWPAAALAEIAQDLGLAEEIRAEAVTREQFVELARRLPAPTNSDTPP